MLLQDGPHRLKQSYDCGCHQKKKPWHFPRSFALNSPYHSHREQPFVCHEVWGFSSIWAYFPDSSLISGKTSLWQMNLSAVQGAQELFSAINLINILIMNLEWRCNQIVRLSGWGLCDGWMEGGVGSLLVSGAAVIPGAGASYQHLTHSLSNFLCVAIKWRLSGLLKGSSWVSGENSWSLVSCALCRTQKALWTLNYMLKKMSHQIISLCFLHTVVQRRKTFGFKQHISWSSFQSHLNYKFQLHYNWVWSQKY